MMRPTPKRLSDGTRRRLDETFRRTPAIRRSGVLLGVHRVEQDHAGDLLREQVGEVEDVDAAGRMSGKHIWSRLAGSFEQRVEIGCCLNTVRGPEADWLQPRPAGRRRTPWSWLPLGEIQAMAVDGSPSPGSSTTVGLPVPAQLMWRLWSPTSISRPGIE